ncbi:MAG: universal stress protein [Nitrospiraceae bacterium]|nr:universal stress protein [Nitrospiraceae bacterium]
MKILFATDGSEHSEDAARLLTKFNLTSNDGITIFHVIGWVPFEEDKQSYYANLKFLKQEIGGKVLDSALEVLKPSGARLSTALDEGFPDKSIVAAAIGSNADMIALGARGIKGLKSVFLGSVTRAVAISSPVPVLVVKNSSREKKPSEKMKVLFATDGSDSADSAARFLSGIPFPEGTEMSVINVGLSAVSDIPERFIMEVTDAVREEVARVRASEFARSEAIIGKTKALLGDRFSKVTEIVKIGDPAAEILAEAESSGADIVTVGCRGLRGFRGMMGSVSRRVLGHAACSVLLAKTCGGG